MNDVRWSDGGDAAVADHVARVVDRPERSRLAVPGGATPVPIFEMLAARELPWDRVTIMPIDDRLVPAGHPASNFGLLQRMLGTTGADLEPIEAGVTPDHFDLVWIGMGADGHVASIFPNAVDDLPTEPSAVRTWPDPLPPEAPFERVTLTFDALTDADDMIIVIKGGAKRDVLEEAQAGRNDLPVARLLARRRSPLTVYWSAT